MSPGVLTYRAIIESGDCVGRLHVELNEYGDPPPIVREERNGTHWILHRAFETGDKWYERARCGVAFLEVTK